MSSPDWASAHLPGQQPVIHSIMRDFTAESLEELRFWLEQNPPAIPIDQIVGYQKLLGTTYDTTLPTGAGDDSRAVLVDSLTNPTFQWMFRYNANSVSAYKWEFIGGAPAMPEVTTAETTASTTYAALTTPGPSFALPRPGIYDVAIGFDMSSETSAANVRMSYDIGATGAVDADSAHHDIYNPFQFSYSVFRERRKTVVTAVTLTAKYKTSAGTIGFENRWMRVTPVRVS